MGDGGTRNFTSLVFANTKILQAVSSHHPRLDTEKQGAGAAPTLVEDMPQGGIDGWRVMTSPELVVR